MWWPIAIIIWLLILSALFSSSELAIMGVPMYKIKRYITENIKNPGSSKLLLALREKSERTLIAILIGNNLVNVALSIYASTLWDTLLAKLAIGGAAWFLLISVSITFFDLIFWWDHPQGICCWVCSQVWYVGGTVYSVDYSTVVSSGASTGADYLRTQAYGRS